MLDSASTQSTLRLDSNSVLTSLDKGLILLLSTPSVAAALALAAAVTNDLTSLTGEVVEMLCRRVKVEAAAAAEAVGELLNVVVVRAVVVVVSETSAESPFSALVFLLSVLPLL